MGMHSGDVVRQIDINGMTNVSGDGINVAQRVMDFGDSGHILMSLDYAKQLQEAGDPAATDCYDIGIAVAKHGKRIHLFNFHRPAIGTSDVPVKVRKDDQWVRPKQLRLGTSGHNIVVATFQIIGWLFSEPLRWRTHVTQIDPRLSPNFTVIDLTGLQIRRNRDLRQLLLQVYVICPAIMALLIWAVLTPLAAHSNTRAIYWIGTMLGMGMLATVLLGIGAGLIAYIILTFQAVVEGPAAGLAGIGSAADMIALSAVCGWAFVALSAVFPAKRQLSALREVIVAITTAVGVVFLFVTLFTFSRTRSPLESAIATAVAAFVLVNVVVGMRWKQWSRGFAFGQFLGLAAAGSALAAASIEVVDPHMLPVQVLTYGLFNGIMSATAWAAAFAVAEKLAGARAAIMGGLMVSALINVLLAKAVTGWLFLPFLTIWAIYGILRKRLLQIGAIREPIQKPDLE